jgi:phage shock protein PspC (stress-responsive transcriptional regulator)
MKKFHRVEKDSMIFGVCTGLEEMTNISAVVWRLLFFFGGFGTLYLVLAAVTFKK